jgi:hypothetical protein
MHQAAHDHVVESSIGPYGLTTNLDDGLSSELSRRGIKGFGAESYYKFVGYNTRV